MQCQHSAWNVISITDASYGGSLSFIFTLEPSVSPSHRHGSEKQQQLELLVICLLFHFRPQRISKVFWCFLGRVFLMDRRGVAAGKLYGAGGASWSQGVGTPSGSFCSLAPQRTFSGSGRRFSRSTHLSLELDIHDVMIWSVSASPHPVSASWDHLTKRRKRSSFNHRNVSPPSSGDRKSRMQMWTELVHLSAVGRSCFCLCAPLLEVCWQSLVCFFCASITPTSAFIFIRRLPECMSLCPLSPRSKDRVHEGPPKLVYLN